MTTAEKVQSPFAERHELRADITNARVAADTLRGRATQLVAEKKQAEPKLRLNILDSIRGWAAIDVLIFHVSHEMFADKLPEFGAYWLAVAHPLSLAAAVFLFAIYSNNRLQSLFDNRFSHFLGELSFPVYLVHLPIVVSLESYLILRLCADGIVTRGSAYFIILVTLAASLFAAWHLSMSSVLRSRLRIRFLPS